MRSVQCGRLGWETQRLVCGFYDACTLSDTHLVILRCLRCAAAKHGAWLPAVPFCEKEGVSASAVLLLCWCRETGTVSSELVPCQCPCAL